MSHYGESRTARADRDPHRDLPLARDGAHEQQARNVHTRDHEHHQHHTASSRQHRSRRDREASAPRRARNA